MKAFIKKMCVVISTIILLFSCNNNSDKNKLIDEIKTKENKVFSVNNFPFDYNEAGKLIKLYEIYISKYPNDTIVSNMLFKCVEISTNTNQFNKAIDYCDRIINNNFEKKDKNKAKALFLKAFIYDNNLHNVEKAKELYLEFIKLYPNDELIDDAKMSIEMLGKTPDEILKQLEKKNI